MSAPPFTPGEWIADALDLTIRTADGKLDIAMVFDDGSCPAEQLKADVHLLGAAKALYEALLRCRSELRNYERTDTGGPNSSALNAIDEASAAIAQAEGHR